MIEPKDGEVVFDVPVTLGAPRRVVFRVPDLEDFCVLDGALPLLGGDVEIQDDAEAGKTQSAMDRISGDPAAMTRFLERADRLLVLTAIEPRIVAERNNLLAVDQDDLFVRAIPSVDRVSLLLTLTALAGFTRAAEARMVPFSGRGQSSSPATESDIGMADSPTRSSMPADDPAGVASSG